ncbi:MAG TPA: DUF5681 domain-containing protein [Terracidiphilus sp.]|jgi:hypothetical protein
MSSDCPERKPQRRPDGTFKKGSTANRDGRPTGSRSRHTIIREVLAEIVPVQLGGRRRKIRSNEAAVRLLLKKALGGDRPALLDVIRLWAEVEEAAEKARGPDYSFADADRDMIAEIHGRMKACLGSGSP